MNIIDSIMMQLPSLTSLYTKHPLFPDMLTAMIAAPLIATGMKLDEKGEAKGACSIRGEVYLWGWFLMTSFAFSGIISKATQTALPSLD
jgi:uncharacterized membrane protein (DUF106 family)